MIESQIVLNERDARRVRATVTRIQSLLSADSVIESTKFSLPIDVVEQHRRSMAGALLVLNASLSAFERAKSGDFTILQENWKNDPGMILIVARIARNMSQSELATKLAMREQQLQRYEAERYRSISLQNYQRIARMVGVEVTASIRGENATWLDRAASQEVEYSPAQMKSVVEHATLNDWIGKTGSAEDKGAALIEYIGASNSLSGTRGLLRTGLTTEHLEHDLALSAWRARVIHRAARASKEIESKFDPFDISWLHDLVSLSVKSNGVSLARDEIGRHGIVLVAEPQIPGLKLDGAAFLLDERPVVGITIRHDRIDNFWFTILHELAHVYLHYLTGLAAGFFDDLDNSRATEQEEEANNFAGNLLIPPERWRGALARISRSAGPINEFAKQLGIHPAIVYGRIRNERSNYSIFSDRIGLGEVRRQLLS